MEFGKKIFIWISPLPLILFFALSIYVSRYEGWGAWAAAPMLLPPVFLSFIMLITGVGFTIHSRKLRESTVSLVLATSIAGSLFIFLLGRAVLKELAKSFL
ncbi:MAG: hypothetical protein ACQ9MH_05370 [Nitrospinales bacterium]